VLWADDLDLTDLGLFFGLSTAALDVNDAGVAVGNVLDAQGDVILAAVWRGNGAEDLNALIQPGSGWFLKEAQAINERGEIVGFGTSNGMQAQRPYLLRPDCDGDGISDLDEIAAGTADDSNHDGVADECQHCQTDLGFAGPGAMGLRVCGDPLTLQGSSATVALTQVPGGMPVFLVVGLTNQPTPIAGGMLVPAPLLILSGFVAAPDGSIRFPLHGSAALPQAIFVQAVALVGPLVQFSNALRVVIGLL